MTLLGEDLESLDDDGSADLRLRAVGMIYQGYNLFSGFTVRQNVRLPLQLITRRPPFDASQRTNQLLADFGLPDLAERYPAELSGGQQQLAAIARALAANPPLILADEPTANLDTTMSRQIVSRLRALADSGQHGVILATHDLRVASQADRVLRACAMAGSSKKRPCSRGGRARGAGRAGLRMVQIALADLSSSGRSPIELAALSQWFPQGKRSVRE